MVLVCRGEFWLKINPILLPAWCYSEILFKRKVAKVKRRKVFNFLIFAPRRFGVFALIFGARF